MNIESGAGLPRSIDRARQMLIRVGGNVAENLKTTYGLEVANVREKSVRIWHVVAGLVATTTVVAFLSSPKIASFITGYDHYRITNRVSPIGADMSYYQEIKPLAFKDLFLNRSGREIGNDGSQTTWHIETNKNSSGQVMDAFKDFIEGN